MTAVAQDPTFDPGVRRRRTRGTSRLRTSLLPGERLFSPMRLLALLILAVMAVLWVLPFLWAIATSLKTEEAAAAAPVTWVPPDGFTFNAYANVIRDGEIPLWMWNSLLTATVITALTLASAALVAYALSRIDF